MQKIIIVLLFFFQVSILGAQSKAVENFVSDYTDIAFNNEPSYSYLITKWKQGDTLAYFIEGKTKYLSERKLAKYFDELSIWTGLTFQKAIEKEEANFHIIFGDLVQYFHDYELDPIIMKEQGLDICYKAKFGTDRIIKSASFCVDASRIELAQVGIHGIYRAVLHCIGMTGDIYNPGSIFHSQTTLANSTVTRRDRQMLKLHYSNVIKAGMDRNEVAQVFTNVIDPKIFMKLKL